MNWHNLKFLIGIIFILAGCMGGKKLEYPQLLQAEELKPVVIAGANVFDSRSAAWMGCKNVYLKDGRIEVVEDCNTDLKSGYEVVDGSGKFLIPGLIDAHVHLGGNASAPYAKSHVSVEDNLRSWVYAGITTVYDMGGFAKQSRKYRDKIEDRKLIGPQVFYTHSPITVPGGHPIPAVKQILPWPLKGMVSKAILTIERPEDAVKILDKLDKLDVDYVKLIVDALPPGSPQMSRENVEALVDESHKRGYKVFVHVGDLQNLKDAKDAGADVMAHITYKSEIPADLAAEMAGKIPVVATAVAFDNVAHFCTGDFYPEPLTDEIHPEELTAPVTGAGGKEFCEYPVVGGFAKAAHEHQDVLLKNLQVLHEQGVTVLPGTDSPVAGSYPGGTYHAELQLMSKAGWTTAGILQLATWQAAKLFLQNPDFGAVEAGMRADLLLLDADPVRELENLRKINLIFLNGRKVQQVK